MIKQILIVGGGISGLTVLHGLKKKYAHRGDIQITLLEKNDYLGGTIRTLRHGPFIFEAGPNGFLSSKPSTLEFIRELGLEGSLLSADKEAKERFISLGGILYKIPTDPVSFL